MVAGADLTGNDLFPRFSQAEFDRRHRAVRQAMAQEVKPNGGEPLHNYPFKFPVCGL
jgi:hypothetical protein